MTYRSEFRHLEAAGSLSNKIKTALLVSIILYASVYTNADEMTLASQESALSEAREHSKNRRFFDALNAIRPAAESGYAPAQHFYAYLNWGGSFYDEAYIWYEKAAQQGHQESMYGLISLILENEVLDKDTKTAIDWLTKLATKDESKALEFLFKINRLGRTDWPANGNVSLQWLTKGLQAKQPWAMFEWSLILENGDLNQSKNNQQSLYWLTQAGEQGYRPAINKLIEVYSTPLLSQKDDQSQVRYWSSK
jgi:TPR repeat protein